MILCMPTDHIYSIMKIETEVGTTFKHTCRLFSVVKTSSIHFGTKVANIDIRQVTRNGIYKKMYI